MKLFRRGYTGAPLIAVLLPIRVRYWVLQHEGAKHVGGPEHPYEEIPAVPFTVVLERAYHAAYPTRPSHIKNEAYLIPIETRTPEA